MSIGLLAISLTTTSCTDLEIAGEDPTTAAQPSVTATSPEEVERPPLWTEADGERTVYCPARNGYQEATITLPASSPFTDELNSLLSTHDGRPPLTVLSVRETEPPFSFDNLSRIDETTYLHTVAITTPGGVLELGQFDPEVNPTQILSEARLIGWAQQTARPELNDWAQDLRERIEYEYDYQEWSEVEGESRVTDTVYFATQAPLTHIDSITLRWGSSGGYGECNLL